MIQVAKENPCVDCGERHPYYVMQLDHVRGEKLFQISAACSMQVGLERLRQEIEKCEAVCANCHAVRTYERFMADVARAA